jgi:hypothetical protein
VLLLMALLCFSPRSSFVRPSMSFSLADTAQLTLPLCISHQWQGRRRAITAGLLAVAACFAVVALIGGEGDGERSPVFLATAAGGPESAAALKSAPGAGATESLASGTAPFVAEVKRVLSTAAAPMRLAGATGGVSNGKGKTADTSSSSSSSASAGKGVHTSETIAAAEVKRVLSHALSKAALHASDSSTSVPPGVKQTLAYAPKKQQDVAEGDKKDVGGEALREAAESEAEKDAITAGERSIVQVMAPQPKASSKDASKEPAAGPNQPKNEGKFDKTGLKNKKAAVKKVKKIKLSKGVLEAMKTGLEAGWAEERRAKAIAKQEAAAFYAKLRENMLRMDEKRHEREVKKLEARRNQTTAEGNTHLLDLLDKVYQTDNPTEKETKARDGLKGSAEKNGPMARMVQEVSRAVAHDGHGEPIRPVKVAAAKAHVQQAPRHQTAVPVAPRPVEKVAPVVEQAVPLDEKIGGVRQGMTAGEERKAAAHQRVVAKAAAAAPAAAVHGNGGGGGLENVESDVESWFRR